MYLDYTGQINRMYNSGINQAVAQFKYTAIANATEVFNQYFIKINEHPYHLKCKLRGNWEAACKVGREQFGMYYGALFAMYLEELN